MSSKSKTTAACLMLALGLLAVAIPGVTAHESTCAVENFACTCQTHTHQNNGTWETQRCSGMNTDDCDFAVGAERDEMVGILCDEIIDLGDPIG